MNITTFRCNNLSTYEYTILDNVEYWVGGIVVIAISVIGIILNICGICLISKRLSKQNTFNHLLMFLFLVDMIYLILSILYVMQIKLLVTNYALNLMFPKFIFPMCHVFLTLSVFMTLGIAYERSVAVSRPLHRRKQMLSRRFRQTSLAKCILSIVFYSILFNIPKFFEFESKWIPTRRYAIKYTYSIIFLSRNRIDILWYESSKFFSFSGSTLVLKIGQK